MISFDEYFIDLLVDLIVLTHVRKKNKQRK